MSNRYQYRQASHSLYGPVGMERPPYVHWTIKYANDAEAYEQHLASLPLYCKVDAGLKFKDGEILEEGKDFTLWYPNKVGEPSFVALRIEPVTGEQGGEGDCLLIPIKDIKQVMLLVSGEAQRYEDMGNEPKHIAFKVANEKHLEFLINMLETNKRIAAPPTLAVPLSEHGQENNLELFKNMWYSRNPVHEQNVDNGKDMFWGTAELVAREYCQALASKTEHGQEKEGEYWPLQCSLDEQQCQQECKHKEDRKNCPFVSELPYKKEFYEYFKKYYPHLIPK